MTLAPKEGFRLSRRAPPPGPASWHRGQEAIPAGALNRRLLGGVGAGSPARWLSHRQC